MSFFFLCPPILIFYWRVCVCINNIARWRYTRYAELTNWKVCGRPQTDNYDNKRTFKVTEMCVCWSLRVCLKSGVNGYQPGQGCWRVSLSCRAVPIPLFGNKAVIASVYISIFIFLSRCKSWQNNPSAIKINEKLLNAMRWRFLLLLYKNKSLFPL